MDRRDEAPQAVIGVDADLFEAPPMLLEYIGEEDFHRMTENDGIRDFHHRGLQVNGEKNALGLRVLDLDLEELNKRLLAHEGPIYDLPGEDTYGIFQNGDGPICRDMFDSKRVVSFHGDRQLVRPEIALCHMRDMRFGVGRPSPHGMRMVPGVLFDGLRRSAV